MKFERRYNPLYPFPSRIADFPPPPRGGGRISSEGDGRENWKNTSFDFAVYPRRGMETTAVEAFPLFAWSPKRLFAGRTGPVPPTFSEKYGISVER